MMNRETFEAFTTAGVPDENAMRAAESVASDTNIILRELNNIQTDMVAMEGRIQKDMTAMEGRIQSDIAKIKDDIHMLDKKFLIITTVISTALPIIAGILFFLLRAST